MLSAGLPPLAAGDPGLLASRSQRLLYQGRLRRRSRHSIKPLPPARRPRGRPASSAHRHRVTCLGEGCVALSAEGERFA